MCSPSASSAVPVHELAAGSQLYPAIRKAKGNSAGWEKKNQPRPHKPRCCLCRLSAHPQINEVSLSIWTQVPGSLAVALVLWPLLSAAGGSGCSEVHALHQGGQAATKPFT